MFDPKAELFFEDPGNDHKPPSKFGVLYLLRRDIYRCLGRDSISGELTKYQTLWPGAMAILAGIDLLAKFYRGTDAIGKVGNRFKAFIREYFKPIPKQDEEIIYQLRNALLHSFGLYSYKENREEETKEEFKFMVSITRAPLIQRVTPDMYHINLLALHERFEDSVKRYATDLNKKPELQEKFFRMFDYYGSIWIGSPAAMVETFENS